MLGDSLEGAILATVAYFDVFGFAPSAREIHRFLIGARAGRAEVEAALGGGRVSPGLVGRLGTHAGVWFLAGKEHLSLRRPRFSRHAAMLWPKARHIARLIEGSGVASCGMITGSLAADNADENADIDFLFIYPATRTWTSFALLRILQKMPLLGLSRMCPNYALPDDALEVRPQNLFTAFEIAKAVPMFGFTAYRRFAHANRWVRRFIPNALPLLDGENGEVEAPAADPWLVSKATEAALFRWLEAAEKKRKFGNDRRDAGVDMKARVRSGSVDRHSPTRSSYVLSELFYRMNMLGLEAHPLYREIDRSREVLAHEMKHWAGERIGERPPSPASQDSSV